MVTEYVELSATRCIDRLTVEPSRPNSFFESSNILLPVTTKQSCDAGVRYCN